MKKERELSQKFQENMFIYEDVIRFSLLKMTALQENRGLSTVDNFRLCHEIGI